MLLYVTIDEKNYCDNLVSNFDSKTFSSLKANKI